MKVKLKFQNHIVSLNPPNDIDVIKVVSNKIKFMEDLKLLHAWALDEINDIFGSNCNRVKSFIENNEVCFEGDFKEPPNIYLPIYDDDDNDDLEDTPNIVFQIHCMDHLEKNGVIRKNPFLAKKKQEGVHLYILAWEGDELLRISGYVALEIFPELRNYEINVDKDGLLVHKGDKTIKDMAVLLNSNGYKLID